MSQAIGQLRLRPLVVSPFGPRQRAAFRDAERRLRTGQIGGVILMLGDERAPAAGDEATKQIEELRGAVRNGRPPALVIAALEGITDAENYCAELFENADQLLGDALSQNAGDAAARRFGQAVADFGANAVLTTSFKDGGGCGDGNTADPTPFVRGLLQQHIALFARGAQNPHRASADAGRYAQGYRAGLRLVASAESPALQPTWSDPEAINAIHARWSKMIVGTPDLADAGGSDLLGNAQTALAAGADLLIYSEFRPAVLRTIGTYFRSHRERLELSCRRVMRLKQQQLGSKLGVSACPAAEAP